MYDPARDGKPVRRKATRVIKRVQVANGFNTTWQLECGHRMTRQTSRGEPLRHDCPECSTLYLQWLDKNPAVEIEQPQDKALRYDLDQGRGLGNPFVVETVTCRAGLVEAPLLVGAVGEPHRALDDARDLEAVELVELRAEIGRLRKLLNDMDKQMWNACDQLIKAEDAWLEFLGPKDHPELCGLCGNSGWIDTRNTARTATGVQCGVRRPCICPNGRATLGAQRREE